MQNRIDVIPEMARTANATAAAATCVPSDTVPAPPAPAQPSMFSFMAATLVSNSIAFESARLGLTAHLETIDQLSAQAVDAYVITDEENGRSLSPIREV